LRVSSGPRIRKTMSKITVEFDGSKAFVIRGLSEYSISVPAVMMPDLMLDIIDAAKSALDGRPAGSFDLDTRVALYDISDGFE
jgi:hypothetical protein